MSLPTVLPGLTDREAIIDVIYRATHAWDHADSALLESAFHPECLLELVGRETVRDHAGLHAALDFVMYDLDTTHSTSGIRIQHVPGENKAKVVCNFLNYHWRKGEGMDPSRPKFLGGGYYYVDVEKDAEGTWRAKYWKIQALWVEGDAAVVSRG